MFLKVSNKLVTKTFPRISILDIKRLPFPSITQSNKAHIAIRQKIAAAVQELISARTLSPTAKTESERVYFEQRATALEAKIDEYVYAYYHLTPEEKDYVERSLAAEA